MTDSRKLHDLINEQIDQEFFGAHQYVATGAYFVSINMPLTSKLFYDHAVEERAHAQRFIDYLVDRSLTVEIGGVEPVVNWFDSPRQAFENAVRREVDITSRIFHMTTVAAGEKDIFGLSLLSWFADEQREEEALFNGLRDVWESCKDKFKFEDYLSRR